MYGRYRKSSSSAFKAGYAAAMKKKRSFKKKGSSYSKYGRKSW